MRLIIDRNFLALALGRCQGGGGERSLAQIGLKASVSKQELTVASLDQALMVYCQVASQVLEESCIFVPLRLFSEVVRELPEGNLELRVEKGVLILNHCGELDFTMKIPLLEDAHSLWREPPLLRETNHRAISGITLKTMIEQMQFCVNVEASRNFGTVALIHENPAGEVVCLVGTDGYRLSCSEGMWASGGQEEPKPVFGTEGVCISKRALGELSRICSEGHELVQLGLESEGKILFAKVSQYEIYILQSAVSYPNYTAVIPKELIYHVELPRGQLLGMLRRVLLSSDRSKTIELTFDGDFLIITGKTFGVSEGVERMPIAGYTAHDPTKLVVNGRFLLDVLNHVESPSFVVSFKDPETPLVLTPTVNQENCPSKHVLVPIKEYREE